MKSGLSYARVCGCVFCVLLLSPLVLGASAQGPRSGAGYSNTSWALGVVVPEGSRLSDGTGLQWESVGNVTALVSLPNITLPDRVVYSILSVATSGGGVIQVATGMYPNRTEWLTYSWAIPNAASTSPIYQWVLNGSEPDLPRNSRIAISIFRSGGLWNLKVVDMGTGSSIVRFFPPGVGGTLVAGDQEVFALESYSRASSTFRTMGNLTLGALLVDGQKVTSGFYAYGDWDPNHNPVFAVGSSGTSPPAFISLSQPRAGSFVWGFSGLWPGGTVSYDDWIIVILAATSMAALFIVILAWRLSDSQFPKLRTVSSR